MSRDSGSQKGQVVSSLGKNQWQISCAVDLTSSGPRVTEVIPAGAPVSGVTSLGDDVFVVRDDNRPQVEVYDAVRFTLQHRLFVPGLDSSLGLAACASNKCLYAADYSNDRVHRVELSVSNAVTRWSVGRHPAGLAVNIAKNVLVVMEHKRTLQEFTTHGALLQTIQLKPHTQNPTSAIQLSNGQFVTSHSGTRQHRVCLLDVKGAVVGSYGDIRGSDLTKMSDPSGLAVDQDKNILVADQSNNRLLVLDRSLTGAREMPVSVDGGLSRPFSLWYDTSRGRLYVGECCGRVIIIDHLKDFTSFQVAPRK